MEQNQLLDCIDVRLVKEQLRLLGHDVTDDVILSFVKGLAGGAEQHCADGAAAGAEACQDVQHTAAGAGPKAKGQQQHAVASSSWKDTSGRNTLSNAQAARRKAPSVAQELLDAGPAAASTAAAATPQQAWTGDVPCRLQQADQQSPKPALQGSDSPAAVPQASLDQRCRKFLARLADRQSTQQQQQQLVPPGTRSRASLAELSDSASDGDQEQASYSPLPHYKGYGARHSTTGTAGMGAATCEAATGGHAVYDDQPLAGAVRALHIEGDHAQQRQQQLDSRSSSQQPQQPGSLHSVLDAGSDVVFEVQPDVSSSGGLPRFGFRPGYKPVGMHLPPPPGQEALALMQQTSGSRSSRAGDTIAAAEAGRFARNAAADSAPLQCGSSACSWLKAGQQQQSPQHLVARMQHHASPSRAAPGLRASSDSIIGDAITGASSSCFDARPIRVSKDGSGPSDPLYHAPASPTGAAGGSGSSRQAGNARSPAADSASAPAAGSSRPRSVVFEHPGTPSHLASSEHAALLTCQSCYSRAPTSSSRSSVAPSTAGGSSYGGVSSGSSSGAGSSLSRYCQQLSWNSGRSTAMAPGVRKTDRVARFQKMQQAWQKDRYLNTGGARKGTTASTSGSRPAAAQPVRSKPTWDD